MAQIVGESELLVRKRVQYYIDKNKCAKLPTMVELVEMYGKSFKRLITINGGYKKVLYKLNFDFYDRKYLDLTECPKLNLYAFIACIVNDKFSPDNSLGTMAIKPQFHEKELDIKHGITTKHNYKLDGER